MGISERVREILSDKSLTLQDLSDRTEIKYRTIQNYLGGSRGVGADFLTAMSERLGVSASWLLTGQGPKYVHQMHPNEGMENHTATPPPNDAAGEFVAIPRFDVHASAGFGSLVEAEVGSGYYAYNRAFLQRRGLSEDHLSVISVSGDSMEPELSDKDLILIATDQKEPRNGFMFAVYFDGQLFVKRVQRLPGNRLHLISTNDRYPPIIVDLETTEDVRLVGRVVASMHEW